MTWAGASLPIARRQARALLYRLAVHLAPLLRIQLGYLFWPDVPDTAARRNLTHLLTVLRRALPPPALLLTDGETIALHPQHVWADTNTFACLTSTADAQVRPSALAQALDLYRGPLLDRFALPDCPEFEAWLDLERSAWERRSDDALAELTTLLGSADVRLLTLAGPGGAGKTRLAIEVARALAARFADGAVFVPLSPLRDPTAVLPAIATALGLGERDDRPPLVRLQDALCTREILLLLDNFEHVVEAAADVAALLAAAPRLNVLVGSRALLRIAGEYAYAVPPLPVPDMARLPPPLQLAEIGAVALLLARIRERVPGFRLSDANAAELAAICARLDGLPLAIELVAARAALLSPRCCWPAWIGAWRC
ncbi:MAG TPA: AAA family ATPase [Roseiflexaceae bacterium]|nr:AAA family ATPase [Roseiflexaceae bacterium]